MLGIQILMNTPSQTASNPCYQLEKVENIEDFVHDCLTIMVFKGFILKKFEIHLSNGASSIC